MINVSEFLQPISEKSECGEYLLYDPVYDQLREYVREDDPQLSQGVWQIDLKKANWRRAREMACDLLKNRTKDVQMLAWLTEALTALDGMQGLINGLNITAEVTKKFWTNIHPLDTGNNRRLRPFFYLSDKIAAKLAQFPITEAVGTENQFYTLADLLTAQYNFKIKNTRGLSIRNVKKILLATSYDFLHSQKELTNKCLAELGQLAEFLSEKYNNDAPSFKDVSDNLAVIKRVTEQALEKVRPPRPVQVKIEQPEQPISIVEEPEAISESSTEPEQGDDQELELTVEHAYNVLNGIANFLQQKQPQSPASILIKIATAIGEKSFQELLDINMNSGASVMNTISELYKILNVGIKKDVPKDVKDIKDNSKVSK